MCDIKVAEFFNLTNASLHRIRGGTTAQSSAPLLTSDHI
jgi:hypothetical protein